MEKIKNMKKSTKAILLILLTAVLGTGGYFGYKEYVRRDMEKYLNALTASLSMSVNENVGPVEYGSAFDQSILVKECSGELKTEGTIDTSKTGVQTVHYTVYGNDEKYGQYAEKKYEASVEVVDTQFPVIEIEKDTLTVTEGTPLNVMPNIRAVSDPVDGELPSGDGLSGSYTAVSDLNTDKPGNYTVTVSASDVNGNQTTKEFKVTVKEKPKPTPTPAPKKTASSGGTVKANTSGNYSSIYSYLTGTLGLNKAAACGILANICRESGFNPNTGGTYYGLCQWGGGRKSNLKSWCSKNGYDYTSVTGQLAFMHHELTTSYKSAWNGVRGVENTEDGAAKAAEIFCRQYERAAKVGTRPDLARSYFNK